MDILITKDSGFLYLLSGFVVKYIEIIEDNTGRLVFAMLHTPFPYIQKFNNPQIYCGYEKVLNISCHACRNLIIRILGVSTLLVYSYVSLACLPVLNTLNASHNKLQKAEDIEELTKCPNLSIVDLSHNKLDDPKILDVFMNMKNLVSLKHIDGTCTSIGIL